MKKLSTAILLSMGTLALTAQAHDPKAHVHGKASMQIVVDGADIEIALQSPLESLVGFEHAPRTEQQKRSIEMLEERLAAPAALFMPDAAAKCTAEPARLTLPFRSDGALPAQADVQHADMEATIRFRCERPAELKGMEVKLFDAYSRLHSVDVQMMTPRGQSAARLTPGQHRLRW